MDFREIKCSSVMVHKSVWNAYKKTLKQVFPHKLSLFLFKNTLIVSIL